MHCYIATDTDNNHYWCIDFTHHELKIWYDNKELMECMTKTYLPRREEMIAAYPHLTEII